MFAKDGRREIELKIVCVCGAIYEDLSPSIIDTSGTGKAATHPLSPTNHQIQGSSYTIKAMMSNHIIKRDNA